jgi:hypothetical protein
MVVMSQQVPASKLQMAMAFSIHEGKMSIWMQWDKITQEVNNPNVQREEVVNWIKELMIEMCITA